MFSLNERKREPRIKLVGEERKVFVKEVGKELYKW